MPPSVPYTAQQCSCRHTIMPYCVIHIIIPIEFFFENIQISNTVFSLFFSKFHIFFIYSLYFLWNEIYCFYFIFSCFRNKFVDSIYYLTFIIVIFFFSIIAYSIFNVNGFYFIFQFVNKNSTIKIWKTIDWLNWCQQGEKNGLT